MGLLLNYTTIGKALVILEQLCSSTTKTVVLHTQEGACDCKNIGYQSACVLLELISDCEDSGGRFPISSCHLLMMVAH